MAGTIESRETADKLPEQPTAEAAEQKTEETPKPRRKWRRRLLRAALVMIVLLVAGGIWGKLWLDRIEREAAALSEAGTSLNKFLKSYVGAMKERDSELLLTHFDDDYYNQSEGNWQLDLKADRDGVQVYTWRMADAGEFRKQDNATQAADLLAGIKKIDQGKFKISSIETLNDDGSATIRGVLWLRGSGVNAASYESRASFRMHLNRHGQDWKIARKELLHGETVMGSRKGFTDVTKQAGIEVEAVHNALLEKEEWFPKTFGIMRYATSGVAAADYDNDGWYDVFYCNGGRPALYRNQGDGTFQDTTSQAGLSGLEAVQVALFADLDNDGDKDLMIGRGTGNNFLFRNNADGTFTDVSEGSGIGGIWVATAAAADYDNDGLIDLYFGRYLDPRTELPDTNFYTRNGEGNSLLRNEGNLQFRDVTEESGTREGGLSLGVAWGDYDRDGDQDVYVANDFGRNALLRNEGDGTFTDVSLETGTIDIGYGMSSSFEDVDNDGDLDIYVAAVHSGQRWFGNSATLHHYLLTSVKQGTIFEDFSLYREIFKLVDGDWQSFGEDVIGGNTLMLNNGDGTFTDVSEECRVNPHGWYWSSHIFDFDNDTDQDIYTVNGWITGKEKDDL